MANLEGLSFDTRVALEKARVRIREKFDYELPITSGFRSYEEQSALYSKREFNPYPVAKPGTSRHEKGNALDIGVSRIPKQIRQAVLDILAEEGLSRPHANDAVHFEFNDRTQKGMTLAEKFGGAPQGTTLAEKFGGTKETMTLAEKFGATKKIEGPTIGSHYSAGMSDRALAPLFNTDLVEQITPGRQTTDVLRSNPSLWNVGTAALKVGDAFLGGLEEFADINRRTGAFANALMPTSVEDLRRGAEALGQVGRAAGSAYQNWGQTVTPTDVAEATLGMQKGITPRWAYNTAAVGAYVADFFTNPVGLLTGEVAGGAGRFAKPYVRKGVESVGQAAGVVGSKVGELAERGVQFAFRTEAPRILDRTARVKNFTNRVLESVGVGPNMAFRKKIQEELHPELDKTFGRLESIALDIQDDFTSLMESNTPFRNKTKTWFENRFSILRNAEVASINELRAHGASPLDEAIRRYVLIHGIGPGGEVHLPANKSMYKLLDFIKDYHVPPQVVEEHGSRLLNEASEAIVKLRSLGVPTASEAFSKKQKHFLNRFFHETLGRASAERAGEVGSSRIAGTGVLAVRQGGLRQFAKALHMDPTHAKPVGTANPLERGWVKVPDDPFHMEFGPLRGMQVPEHVYRLFRQEANLANRQTNEILRSVGIPTDEGAIPLLTAMNWVPRLIVQPIKVGKLSNFVTQFTNFAGNIGASLMAATRAEVDPKKLLDFPKFKQSWEDVVRFKRSKGRAQISDIHEVPHLMSTLANSTFLSQGVAREDQIAKVIYGTKEDGSISGAKYTAPLLDQVKTKLGSVVDFQNTVEMANRLHLYRTLKREGLDQKTASDYVSRFLFDYSDRSDLLEALDRYGLWIFNAYPTKAFNLLMSTLVENPGQVAYYPRLKNLLHEDVGGREQYENLPDYEKGLFTFPVSKDFVSSVPLVGEQLAAGLPGENDTAFVNMARFHPIGQSANTAKALYTAWSQGESLPEGSLREIASTPLIIPFVSAIFFNQRSGGDPDIPRTIAHPGAPPEYQMPARWKEAVKGIAPPLLLGSQFWKQVEAGLGITNSDYRWSEARPFAKATLENIFGVRLVDGEDPLARQVRQAPQLSERVQPAAKYAGLWLQAAQQMTRENNPYYEQAARKGLPELQREMGSAKKYFRDLLLSGRSVNTSGELTTEGKREIADGATYIYGLLAALKDKLSQKQP